MTLRQRLVRYSDLIPCTTAFVDTRTPGSDRKENFTIIGPGVAENPAQHVHIREPHGFNIGGARQPPGCLNSQHSHLTAEVFVVHSGHWAFYGGEHADAGRILLNPGDVISVPTQAFRGFENVGETTGFLFSVLGGDDPGRVTWAPSVFETAKKYGLVLLENGALIDTQAGQTLPADIAPMAPASAEELAALQILNDTTLADCVVRSGTASPAPDSLYTAPGCIESALLGNAIVEVEGAAIPGGKLPGGTGFHLRQLSLAPNASTRWLARSVPEVLFVHVGSLNLEVEDEQFTLGPGDVFTIPLHAARRLNNPEASDTTLFSVLGTEHPQGRILQ